MSQKGSQDYRRDPFGKIMNAPVPFDKLVRRKSRAKPDDFRSKGW